MSGEGRDRVEAIANKIASWAAQTNWEDPDAADRALEDVFDGPDKYIDPAISPSANWEDIKNSLNLVPSGQAIKESRDFDAQAQQAAEREVQRLVDEYGPVAVSEAVYARDRSRIDQPPELIETVVDLLDEVPPDFFDQEIRTGLNATLRNLELDFTVEDRSRLEALEDELRELRASAETNERERVVNELGRAFGTNADDLDQFIDRLQDRLDADIDRSEGIVRAEVDGDDIDIVVDVQRGPQPTEDERRLLFDRVRDEVDLASFVEGGEGVTVTNPALATFVTEDGIIEEFDASNGKDAAARSRGDPVTLARLPTEAANRLRAPQGLSNLLNRYNEDALRTLAREIEIENVSLDEEEELREAFEAIDRFALAEATEGRPGLEKLTDALGLGVSGPISAFGRALAEAGVQNIRTEFTAGQSREVLDALTDADDGDPEVAELVDLLTGLSEQEQTQLVVAYGDGNFFDSPWFEVFETLRERGFDVEIPPPPAGGPGVSPGGAGGDGDVPMIEDAETGERMMPSESVNVPDAELAVTPGRGKDATHFRKVLQELRGEREPDKIPEEEIERLQRAPAKRAQLENEAERQLNEKLGPVGGGGGGGGGGGSAGSRGADGPLAGGTPSPGDRTSDDRLRDIADGFDQSRFSITDRPDPGNERELRRRFPNPQTRMAFQRVEQDRIGQQRAFDPVEYIQAVPDESWPGAVTKNEFLAAQQIRFFEGGPL